MVAHEDWVKLDDPEEVEKGLQKANRFNRTSDGYRAGGVYVDINDGSVEYIIEENHDQGALWEFANNALSRSQDVTPDFLAEVLGAINPDYTDKLPVPEVDHNKIVTDGGYSRNGTEKVMDGEEKIYAPHDFGI